MEHYKIAVLLSTYNGSTYLTEQIESIIKQNYKNWDLYIRDDGSTDSTIDIINYYSEHYDNINFIKDNINLGAALSFMRLLEQIEADYYMFCDQDDIWFENKINLSYNLLKSYEDVGNEAILIFSDATITDQNLEIIDNSFWNYNKTHPSLLFLNHDYINIYNCAPGCTMIFNKELKKYLSYDEKILMHDWYIIIKALQNGIVRYINQPLMFYRQHENNVVGADKISIKQIFLKIINLKRSLKLQIDTFKFVSRYTNINIFEFYNLKIKFNFLRFGIK